MTFTEFADDQAAAINAAVRWFLSRAAGERPFLIYGPAGTGKTSIARRIAELTAPNSTVFVAMTGKAASVLESKGCKARTIHSAIYSPKGDTDEVKALRQQRKEELALGDADPELIQELTRKIKQLTGGNRFTMREREKAFDGEIPGLVIVDEGSMVSSQIAADLASYGIPVLVLGDPFQLPPVKAPPGYTQAPDVMLSTVHRYQGPLLEMATLAREGKEIPGWTPESRAGRRRGAYTVDRLSRFDQVIVHKNKTRWEVIRQLRAAQDRPAGEPTPGDKIMVIRNDIENGVVNGQQAIVASVERFGPADWLIHTTDRQAWTVDGRGFLGEAEQAVAKEDRDSDLIAATFAQAITCYAAQGSEWPAVAVIDESVSREWLYTAVTRAQQECIVLSRKPLPAPLVEGGVALAA
jgi:exodeoxyribonuclease-5